MCISIKLSKGRATKAKKGDKPTGVTPYGYSYSTDKKHIIVNEHEAGAVKLMFTLAQCGKSLQYIADELNKLKLYTRRGNHWEKMSVWTILKNDFYTGVLTYRNTKISGNHKAIISKIQFGKVQSQLNKKNKKNGH